MKTLKVTVLIVLLAFLMQACTKGTFGIKGEGPMINETRYQSGFDRIQVSIDAVLEIVQDSVFNLEISAQNNVLAVIETEVVDKELRINYRRNVWEHKRAKLTLHAPAIKAITLSGSGDIWVQKSLSGPSLELRISGSGTLDIPVLNVDQLVAYVSGSGNVSIKSGSVTTENYTISGSGKIESEFIPCSVNTSNISGSGVISTYVTEKLTAYISGSGELRYRGSPSIYLEKSGSGKLTKIN